MQRMTAQQAKDIFLATRDLTVGECSSVWEHNYIDGPSNTFGVRYESCIGVLAARGVPVVMQRTSSGLGLRFYFYFGITQHWLFTNRKKRAEVVLMWQDELAKAARYNHRDIQTLEMAGEVAKARRIALAQHKTYKQIARWYTPVIEGKIEPGTLGNILWSEEALNYYSI